MFQSLSVRHNDRKEDDENREEDKTQRMRGRGRICSARIKLVNKDKQEKEMSKHKTVVWRES